MTAALVAGGGAPSAGKISLFIATPCRGGFSDHYVAGVLDLTAALSRQGIPWVWSRVMDQPIGQARDILANEFMASAYSHSLWVDADTSFQPDAVRRMLECEVPFVCAASRLRTRSTGAELTSDAANLRFNTEIEDWSQEAARGAVKVTSTGFAANLVRRDVFARLAAAYPQLHGRCPTDTFLRDDFIAHFIEGHYDGAKHLEDRAFCRRWLDAGGEIHCLLDADVNHAGTVANFGREVWARRDEIREAASAARLACKTLADELRKLHRAIERSRARGADTTAAAALLADSAKGRPPFDNAEAWSRWHVDTTAHEPHRLHDLQVSATERASMVHAARESLDGSPSNIPTIPQETR